MGSVTQSEYRLYESTSTAVVISIIVLIAVLVCVLLIFWAYKRGQRSEKVNAESSVITEERIKRGIIVKEWTQNDVELSDDTPSSCPICNKPFLVGEEVCSSYNESCNHMHHKSCMIVWLQLQNTCPTCNEPFLVESV